MAALHMIMHFANLFYSAEATLRLFREAGWNGSSYLSGAIVYFSMFIIYSAAPNDVRAAK
jgi:hypothetical protein